jgi:hypothetical protein
MRFPVGTPLAYSEIHLRFCRANAVAAAAFKTTAADETVPMQDIARMMKVDRATVSRWFPERDFQNQVDHFIRSIEKLGLRPSSRSFPPNDP